MPFAPPPHLWIHPDSEARKLAALDRAVAYARAAAELANAAIADADATAYIAACAAHDANAAAYRANETRAHAADAAHEADEAKYNVCAEYHDNYVYPSH